MKRMLRIHMSCWLAMLLLLCSGCGQDEQSAVIKDYQDTPQVTLSVLTNESLREDFWDIGYTTADGTQIKVIEYSSEYYEQKNLSYRELVQKRLESNVDIDCYIIHAEDVIEYARHDYWMDLSGLNAVQGLSADALAQSTYDGKVFSIPFAYTGFGLFWNVDMLSEHGLSVPGNLDEFLYVCQTLKAAGITPYLGNKGFALTVPAMACGFARLYAAPEREQLLAELASGATPVSEYMYEGFAFIEMMIDKGYMDPEQALNATPRAEDLAAFLAGEGAFMCGAMQDMSGADFQVVMTGVPVLSDGEVSVVGAATRMAVNPHSPNVEYVVELLDGMVTEEWLLNFAISDRSLSSGRGEYDLSYLPEHARGFARLVQQGNQIPNQDFSLPFNTWEAIRDLCREICAGGTAEEAAQQYDLIQLEQIAAASE